MDADSTRGRYLRTSSRIKKAQRDTILKEGEREEAAAG